MYPSAGSFVDLRLTNVGFLRILFVGDVFGHAGRRIVGEHLAPLIEQRKIDLVVVNAENAAVVFRRHAWYRRGVCSTRAPTS